MGARARALRPQQQQQRDNAQASSTRAGSVRSGLSNGGQSHVGHRPVLSHTHTHTPYQPVCLLEYVLPHPHPHTSSASWGVGRDRPQAIRNKKCKRSSSGICIQPTEQSRRYTPFCNEPSFPRVGVRCAAGHRPERPACERSSEKLRPTYTQIKRHGV